MRNRNNGRGVRALRRARPRVEQLEERLVPAIADVSVTKHHFENSFGTPSAYTIEVINNGPDAVAGVMVADNFTGVPFGPFMFWYAVASGGASMQVSSGHGDIGDIVNLPVGGKVTFTGEVFGFPPTSANIVNTATATLAAGDVDPNPSNNSATDVAFASPGTFLFATGSDAGVPGHVKVYDARSGQLLYSFLPFGPAFLGGVRVATGDVTGDGRDDIVVGAGPGAGPHVKVYDGQDLHEVASFWAFDPAFRGGVFVAAARFEADRFAPGSVVVGADAGALPHVRIFGLGSGEPDQNTPLGSFLAYDASFRGGVRVAAGNVDGVGGDELIVSAGAGAGPHVKVFQYEGTELASFMAYASSFTGGVFVATGDLDGDHVAEILTGAGFGAPPHVKTFALSTPSGAVSERLSFLAFPDGFRGGVRVAAADRDADGLADLILAPGPGMGPNVRAVSGLTLSALDSFFAYDPAYLGGVFVG
jgi:hypothetical protein